MQRCPRCGATRPLAESSCPTCGPTLPAAFELELDLEPVVPRASAPKPEAPPTSVRPSEPARGGASGGLDLDAGSLDGALDVGLEDEPSSARGASPSSRAGAPAPSAAPLASAGPTPRPAGRGGPPAPSSPTKEPTDAEVALVAGFGDPPFEWLPSAGYAIGVLRRRRVLGALVEQVRAESERVRRGAQSDMASLLGSIEARVGDDEEVAARLRPLRELFGQVQTQSDALERAKEQHRADDAALAAELRAGEAAREQLTPERRTAQVWVEDATATLSRLKGELSRLSRELTVAHEDATEAAGESEFAPPEHARRITELEATRARTTQEIVEAEQNLASRRTSLADVDRRVAEAERAIASLHTRRSALARRARDEEQACTRAVQSAEHARLDATEAALRALADDEVPRLTVEEVTRFEALDATLTAAARRRLLHERALVAHHPEAFRRGVTLLAGAAAAAVVLVVLVARML